jgi:quercetin dioxygenase-like cupin family protein
VPALATPPVGVTVTPLAPVGQFNEIKENAKTGDWKAKIKTKGASDLHGNGVTIQPGGPLGWHYHPGPSFVIIRSGTATFYIG